MPRTRKGYNLGPYHAIQPLPELHKGDLVEAWLSQLPNGQQVVLNILRVPHDDLSKEERRAYIAFRNEVEFLKRLRHLNIVRIYPLHPQAVSLRGEWYLSKIESQDESWWFWTMEHLQGGSLASRMQQMGRLPLEEAAEVTYQVGMALDYIHSKGIAHLNVHPENIFLRYPLSSSHQRGELALTGFSTAAKADQEVVEERIAEPEFKSYMAPERIRSPQVSSDQPLDNRPMDVYSLGVLFYHMLAGSPPFTGSDEDVERAILEAAPPPLQRFDVPTEIEDLIFQALQKDPAERPSMERLMTTLDINVPPPRVVGVRVTASIVEEEAPAPVEVTRPPSFSDRLKAPWLALRRLVGRAPSYPAPRLREPAEGATLNGPAIFAWDWERVLEDNEAFELRIWKEGQHDRAGESRKPELEIDLDALVPELPGEGNECFWSVAVVQKTPYRSLSKEAQPRSFIYGEPSEEEATEKTTDIKTNKED